MAGQEQERPTRRDDEPADEPGAGVPTMAAAGMAATASPAPARQGAPTHGVDRGRAPRRASATRVVKLSQRKFFPAELEALVAHAGFRVIERYGDFSFRPLDGAAESQVLVCEPVAKRPRKRPISR